MANCVGCGVELTPQNKRGFFAVRCVSCTALEERRCEEAWVERLAAAPRAYCSTCGRDVPARDGELKQRWGSVAAVVGIECGHVLMTGSMSLNGRAADHFRAVERRGDMSPRKDEEE